MTGSRPAIALMIGLFALLMGGAARAQEDLAAGMTPAQLFGQNCAACHKSPRGLAKAGDRAGGLFGLEHFLAQHYTASGRSAQVIAAYLKSVESAEPPRRSRRPLRRATKPAKPDASKPDAGTGTAKKTDAADGKKTEKPETTTGEKSAKPETEKPQSDKPAAAKPDEKKPASPSEQAKREKPKAAE